MPPTCFDPLWVIFREEQHQLVVDNARIKAKVRLQCMIHPDILRYFVETECEVYSICNYNSPYLARAGIPQSV